MADFKISDLWGIEGETAERDWLGNRLGDLVRSSLELEVRVFDRNPRTGIFVVVLEGRLEPTDSPEKIEDGEPAAPTSVGPFHERGGD